MEVRTSNQPDASVRKTHQGAESVGTANREAAEALAAQLFANALDDAKITRDEAAFLMGGISRSMVDQMCSPTVAKAPSLVQIVLLGPAFHIALIKQLDGHFGLGRVLLAQAQQALGTLAILGR